jgi:N utilization substance protein A
VNELRGEKIDVIRWSPDPSTYISNALSPARVEQVLLVNPEGRQAHVLVAEDQLSLAIGKEGQNVRLAARLTGWKIDIKDVAKYDYEAEHRKLEAFKAQTQAIQEEEEEDEDETVETFPLPDPQDLVDGTEPEEEPEEEDAFA